MKTSFSKVSDFPQFTRMKRTMLFVAVALACSHFSARAAIVGSGDISPLNPEEWTSSTEGYIGTTTSGSVTVSGNSSIWSIGGIAVGHDGNGTLNIEEGGEVNTLSNYPTPLIYDVIGNNSNSIGTVNVTGEGSKWIVGDNRHVLLVGGYGTGFLNIKNGGFVSAQGIPLGAFEGSSGTATISGNGSKAIVKFTISVGNSGVGNFLIEHGGEAQSMVGMIGHNPASDGTATITGTSSSWTATYFFVGNYGQGTLNLGDSAESGGLLVAQSMTIGAEIGSIGTCNFNNGAALRVGNLKKGNGEATLRWNDGTIQNYNATTDLTVSSGLVLKLAETGTHCFQVDAGRTGTVDAILSDASINGTLLKSGKGQLKLTAVNTYSGNTTIAEGTLYLTSAGSLASSVIDVKNGATFNVSAKSGGYSLDAGKTLQGSGTIVGNLAINGSHTPTGIETVRGNYSMMGNLILDLTGTSAGSGYDEVLVGSTGTYNVSLGGTLDLHWDGMNGSTDDSKLWIVKNETTGTLSGAFGNCANGAFLGNHDGRDWFIWYNADATTGNLVGGNDVVIAAVPEPTMMVLLALGTGCFILVRRWERQQ